MHGDIRVAGHWDIGWRSPVMEAYNWNWPLRDFGISKWYMHPITGVKNNEERWVHLNERKDLTEIIEENKDVQHVYFEPRCKLVQNSIWLPDFKHPENVLYIFGSAHFNPVLWGCKRDTDLVVTVPTTNNQGVLWADQCMVLALYDRMIKNDNSVYR